MTLFSKPNKHLRVNIDFARKTLYFLHIANLVGLWIKYIEDKKANNRWYEHHFERHWSDKRQLSDVLGETSFTRFVKVHNICVEDDAVYNIFIDYNQLIKQGRTEEAKSLVKRKIFKKKDFYNENKD